MRNSKNDVLKSIYNYIWPVITVLIKILKILSPGVLYKVTGFAVI